MSLYLNRVLEDLGNAIASRNDGVDWDVDATSGMCIDETSETADHSQSLIAGIHKDGPFGTIYIENTSSPLPSCFPGRRFDEFRPSNLRWSHNITIDNTNYAVEVEEHLSTNVKLDDGDIVRLTDLDNHTHVYAIKAGAAYYIGTSDGLTYIPEMSAEHLYYTSFMTSTEENGCRLY